MNVPPMLRKATVQSIPRFASMRERSFMLQLQDQLQLQYEIEQERERRHEVYALHAILLKPSELREPMDIDTLYEWVLRNGSTNQIFQGAQEVICKTICREMTLLEMPAKGVVCYQGEYGDTFFVIISGSVSLFIDSKRKLRTATDDAAGIQDKTALHPYHVGDGLLSEGMELTDSNLHKYFGSFIKRIGSGGTFGELAVMDPTAKRSCTVICDVPTSFICLKRGAYQRLIRITNSSQLDFTQIEFLETLFFFDGWPHGELTRLSNRLRHVNFPADTFLTRIGSEANMVYFLYAGIVQETVPLIHSLTENGNVYKCSRVENESSKLRSIQEMTLNRKENKKQHKRRIAVELNLYQDHDICGEFPIFFNKPICNTDLLAVTDVKTLIMDRETWKEFFSMLNIDHIRESHHKFRMLAEARENWRQTRIKLALANPGLVLTLSTKAMMHDGKCLCGWCGSAEHTTGDPCCATMISMKKKQADEQKKAGKGHKKAADMGIKAQAVKNTLNFVHSVAESAGVVASTTTVVHGEVPPLAPIRPKSSSKPHLGPAPRSSLKFAAEKIIGNQSSNQTSHLHSDTDPATPTEASEKATSQLEHQPKSSGNSHPLHPTPPRKAAISDFPSLVKASVKLNQMEQSEEGLLPAVVKVEDVRQGAFTEVLAIEYKQKMLKSVRRVSTLRGYYDTRGKVLETLQQQETMPSEQKYNTLELPRKPKIPKPFLRFVGGSKTRQPRPDRFTRRINRQLKKMWVKDHPLPVMEESLRNSG